MSNHGVAQALDIEAYFDRIGYSGRPAPTLDVLRSLHELHPRAIAFENLDPLLRRPVSLDAEALEEKLVRGGRGGWCFEQNLLFENVLDSLGFRVRGLGARVLWNQAQDAVTARSHMVLLVEIGNDRFIADVGFGNLTLTAPLRLAANVEQPTPHEAFRLVPRDESFLLQAKIKDEWRTLYRFGLEQQFLVDYRVSNHFLCTHPSSPFLENLMVARPAADRRYTLSNNALTTHHRDGRSEREMLSSAGAIRTALETQFGLAVGALPNLDAALTRLI